MSNITQDLFAAIDMIVQKRMNEMSFDTTIVGEIKEKKTDHYMVQHGNTAYIAYALNNESYLVGDQVYITIPQGDYNAKKIIVGKVSDNEKVVDQSFLWPVDSIVDIDNKNVTIGSADLKGKYEPQNVNNSLLGTRVLGVKATFQTNLPNANSENSYGLAFSINDQIFGVLDSSEFYNNPFMYLNGYTVEKVIELPYNTSWPDITVQFYKRLDNTADSANIKCTLLNLTLGLKTLVDEENKEITAPKLKLYLNDNQSVDYFSSDKEYEKTINSIFIENKKGYYTGKSLPSGYEIKYFEYKSGYGTDDILAGPNWKHLTNFDGSMSNILYTIGTKDRTAQRNEYRVKAIVKNNETLVAEDIIVFKNIDGGKTDETLGQPNNNDLLIAINGDINHNGIFNVYDSKNCYADDLSKQIINLKVVFADGTEIRESDLIEWTFPQDLTQLLIHYPESEGPELDISKTQSNYSASLRPYFYPGERDTIIKCKVIRNDITYYASKLLTFGYKESQGTSYRLNVKIKRSENENPVRNIMFGWDDELILVPELRDKWGIIVTGIKFDYSWCYNLEYTTTSEKEYQHWTLAPQNNTEECVVRLSDKTKPDGSEHDNGNPNGDLLGCPIVKIKTNTITLDNGLEAQFTTYVPIIWALDDNFANTHTDGATDITIGQLGGYNYNTNSYQIYNYPIGEVLEPAILNASLKSNGKQEHPKLKMVNKRLKIEGQLSLSDDVPAVLIWKRQQGDRWTVWRQPILITQSAYENDILNSWNGAQKIDGKGNYILSSMLGAGTKNDQNQFTGFMMGKARFMEKNITQDKIGLFGFNNGKRTFEVNEYGDAYFEGTIQANAGLIGGWEITPTSIKSKSHTCYLKAVNINTSNPVININNLFKVDGLGIMHATGADIEGHITATSLTLVDQSTRDLQNWLSENYRPPEQDLTGYYRIGNKLCSEDDVDVGDLPKDATYFQVDKKGLLTARNAVIGGKIYAGSGEIAGWTMGTFEDQYTYNNSLYSDAGPYRVFLRSSSVEDDVAFGVKKYEDASNKKTYDYTFYVYNNGEMKATYGNIAGWKISPSFIQSANDPVSTGESGIILNASSNTPSGSSLIVRRQNGNIKNSNGMYPYEDIVFLSGTNSRIAGWNFDSYRMYNANDKWGTGLSTSTSEGDPAFWAGYTGAGATPWTSTKGWTTETSFYVTNKGFLKATNAEIEGKITANKGGKIGGWIIEAGQDYIKSGDSSIWLNGDGLGSYNGDSAVGKMIGLNSNDFTRKNAVLRLGSSPSTAKFILTNDGQIYATAGTIASLKLENNALYTSYERGIDEEYYGDILRDDKQGGFGAEGLFYYSRNYQNNILYNQTKFSISIQKLIEFILKVEDKVWPFADGSDYVEIKHIN